MEEQRPREVRWGRPGPRQGAPELAQQDCAQTGHYRASEQAQVRASKARDRERAMAGDSIEERGQASCPASDRRYT